MKDFDNGEVTRLLDEMKKILERVEAIAEEFYSKLNKGREVS